MTTDTTTAAAAAPAAPAQSATLLPPVASVTVETPAVAPTVAPTATVAAPAVPPAAGPPPVAPTNTQWFYAPGVVGVGDKPPEWFKANKYTSVEEQAKAYVALEKRMGDFTGAPADGKYTFAVDKATSPNIELDETHPVFAQFQGLAKDMQLSQEGFAKIMNTFLAYESSMTPDPAAIKLQIGENADARIGSVAQWAKANLGDTGYNELRSALTGVSAAPVFKLLESVIAKTRQVALPKTDPSVAATFVDALAEINRLQAAVGPNGQRLYQTDSKYRAEVEAKRNAYFKAQEQK